MAAPPNMGAQIAAQQVAMKAHQDSMSSGGGGMAEGGGRSAGAFALLGDVDMNQKTWQSGLAFSFVGKGLGQGVLSGSIFQTGQGLKMPDPTPIQSMPGIVNKKGGGATIIG